MKDDVDLIEVQFVLQQGMAICELMTNISDDGDISSKAINALGLDLHDKFERIAKELNC